MIYWGARQKMIEIGRLEPGDAVEVLMFKKGFTYALLQDGENSDDRYIPPMKGQFYDIVNFWNTNPIAKKVYQVKLPKEKYFQYKFYNGDVDDASKLLVFPNPVIETLTITNTENVNQIYIYNLMGSVVFSKVYTNSNYIEINTHDWNSGYYFVRMENNDGGLISKKFIKK
jgi:hypothetical protein